MQESEATEELTQPTEEAEAPTQRLAFDKDTPGEEVPQLAKRTRKPRIVSDEDPDVEEPAQGSSAPGRSILNEAALQNLAELSIEQLKQQQAELERQIQERQESERTAVITQISEVMGTYNITLESLVEALGGLKFKRKGAKAKAKYRDPATGTTWSGRGKEPSWIKDKDRTPFEI